MWLFAVLLFRFLWWSRMHAWWDSCSHLLSNSIYVNWEIIHFNFLRFMPRSRTAEDHRIEWTVQPQCNRILFNMKIMQTWGSNTQLMLLLYTIFETVSTQKFIWLCIFPLRNGVLAFNLWEEEAKIKSSEAISVCDFTA